MTEQDVMTLVNQVKGDVIQWGMAVLGIAVVAMGVRWIVRLLT